MLKKIFLAILIISILITGFFTFYSYSWLGSVGNPEVTVENFTYFSQIAWSSLWISFIALIIYSAILIWNGGKSWSIWISFIYFSIFIILQTLWLAPSFWDYRKSMNLTEGNFSFTPIVGVMTIFVAGVVVFCVQYFTFRIKEKMFGKELEVSETVEE